MTENTTQAAGCLSRLTAELEAFGWRHMDSAPKDETKVLLLYCTGLGYEVEKGEWYKIEKHNYILVDKEQKLYRKEKVIAHEGWNTPFAMINPIAWQPLPIPTSKL
jgi:hypothetical protein